MAKPNLIEWPQGDLEPNLELTLTQDNGQPVVLATAVRVEITLRRLPGGERVLKRDAVMIDAATGRVDLVWQAGDPVTLAPADYRLLARIIWAGERPQSVPSKHEDRWTLRVFRAAA